MTALLQHGDVTCPRCGAPAWKTNVHGLFPVIACPCVGDRIVVMSIEPDSTATCLTCRGVFDATYDSGRCQRCDPNAWRVPVTPKPWWRRE